MATKTQEILTGDFFARDFFMKQWKISTLIVVLFFLYIYIGYKAQQQHSTLTETEKELQDAQYELLTTQARLTNLSRQSSIAEELEKRGSSVGINKRPVVKIK